MMSDIPETLFGDAKWGDERQHGFVLGGRIKGNRSRIRINLGTAKDHISSMTLDKGNTLQII